MEINESVSASELLSKQLNQTQKDREKFESERETIPKSAIKVIAKEPTNTSDSQFLRELHKSTEQDK